MKYIMNKYATEAKDKVTIKINYERPLFLFPNLSGEQGNPTEYFKLASSQLKKFGFYRESQELKKLRFTPYKEHFNIIARFLDFTNNQQNNKCIKQPEIFSQSSIEEIKKLIKNEHDFSLTNCYGRNHLHYLNDLNSIKLLVETNKQKNGLVYLN